MPHEEITPTPASKILDMTRAVPSEPDRRGPLVYDLTQDASLNGIDPNESASNGVD